MLSHMWGLRVWCQGVAVFIVGVHQLYYIVASRANGSAIGSVLMKLLNVIDSRCDYVER